MNTIIIWEIVSVIFAASVILFILFVMESVISAKLSEWSNRRRIKKMERDMYKALAKKIQKSVNRIGDEFLNDKEGNGGKVK